jgi:hypothetical protein
MPFYACRWATVRDCLSTMVRYESNIPLENCHTPHSAAETALLTGSTRPSAYPINSSRLQGLQSIKPEVNQRRVLPSSPAGFPQLWHGVTKSSLDSTLSLGPEHPFVPRTFQTTHRAVALALAEAPMKQWPTSDSAVQCTG